MQPQATVKIPYKLTNDEEDFIVELSKRINP